MDSWHHLPTYLLEATPPRSSAISAGSAGYSARHPPDIQIAPVSRISDNTLPPDDRILSRLLGALERGLGILPPGLEIPNVGGHLEELNDRTNRLVNKESQVHYHLADLHKISKLLTKTICRAFGQSKTEIYIDSPKQSFWDSQVGDATATLVVDNGEEQTTFSVDMKQPNALFSHAGATGTSGGLQTNSMLLPRGKATGAAAMFIQLALQSRLAQPTQSRFGVFYAGPIFMLTELVDNPHGEGTVLLTSPLFSAVKTPIFDPFGGSSPHDALPSAPIVACFVVLMCQHLQEFAIDKVDELALKVPDLHLRNSVSRNVGNDGRGNGEADKNDEDLKHGSNTYKTGSANFSPRKAPSTSDTVALGPALGNLFLTSVTETPAMNVAYDYPNLSDEPRLAIPISFVSSPANNALSPPDNPSRHPLPLPMKTFLEEIVDDPTHPPDFTLRESSLHSPDTIILRDCIGQGRTGTVWRIASDGPDSPKRVAKVMSCRHIASVMRETLFYQKIFPGSEVASLVPKYYGTYASVDSGWYVIVLEDVGSPVEGYWDVFPTDNMELVEGVHQLEEAFANAGIEHGDVRPSNVLRAQDGSLRLIDFGYSYLESEEGSGYATE